MHETPVPYGIAPSAPVTQPDAATAKAPDRRTPDQGVKLNTGEAAAVIQASAGASTAHAVTHPPPHAPLLEAVSDLGSVQLSWRPAEKPDAFKSR